MELDSVVCMDAYALVESLPEQSADLLLTDAPYNTTACEWEMELDLPRWWTLVKRILKPRAACVMTASQPFTSKLVCSNLEMFRYEWIWVKNIGSNFLNAPREPMKEHEDVLVFHNGAANYYPQRIERKDKERAKYPYKPKLGIAGNGYGAYDFPKRVALDIETRVPSSVLYYNRETGHHFNQKPVALFDYLIRTYTQPGDLIIDPFVGSGTTAVAARNLGRHYICGDQSAEYVAIANKRLSEPFTLPLFTEAVSTETPQTLAMFQEEG